MASADAAATTAPVTNPVPAAAKPYAPSIAIHAAASTGATTRAASARARRRDNEGMAAVSQALVEFANHGRLPPAPGMEVIDTDRYRITLQPDHPIPGPNAVSWIRCAPGEAAGLIDEVRAAVAPRHLPLMWTLDPDTEPADFARHLAARGVLPDAHAAEISVMVAPVETPIATAAVDGLELRDALADGKSFRAAARLNAEAFGDPVPDATPEQRAMLERRRAHQVAAGNRKVLLATVAGEAAGSAGMSLYPSRGAMLNGAAVAARFRGRGIYRALVARRFELARAAGVPGCVVWGGPMSAPILTRLGFRPVGWRRFYVDASTA